MGEVAGIAAAMALKDGITPRKLPVKKLQQELVKNRIKINLDYFK
jgi:hypothetical protein